MKNRKRQLLVSCGVICVLLASIVLAACAPAAPTQQAPTTIEPVTPSPTQQAPTTVKPTVTRPAQTSPAPEPEAEVFTWKFADHMARDSDRSRHQQDMLAAIEEMSDGRMEFQYFGAGELLASEELTDAVSKGVVDWNHSGDYWNAILGNMAILENAATVFLTMEQGLAFWENSGLLERLREIYAEEANVYYVFPALLYGWGDNVYSKQPLDGPQDLKGVPFRTSGLTSRITTKLGAATVWLPWEELYTALQMGTVEAAEWGNFALMWSMGLQDVADYWYQANIGSGYALAEVIYLPSWEALPEDLQEIVYTSTLAYAPKSSSYVIHDDLKAYDEIKEAVTIGDWTTEEHQAEFARYWKEVMDEMGASGDPYTEEIYNIIKDYRMFLNEWPE